jgi:hypothetical protein
LTVSDSWTNERSASAMPNAAPRAGRSGPTAPAGRRARHLRVDVAVVPVVDRARAARGQEPPEAGQRDEPSDGSPATYIVVTVVSSSSDWTFGLVSVT